MLLINKEQKSPAEVLAMFGLQENVLTKLQKHSVFDIADNRKTMDLGTRKMKHGFGLEFPANFFPKDKDGNTIEVRYATSVATKNMENRSVDVYEPRMVKLIGESDQKNDIDEALYFYLHFKNESSPFRENGNYSSLPDYVYDDKSAKAQNKLKELDHLRQAVTHAATVAGEEMQLFARGMGMTNVENIGEDEIRAQLAVMAQQDPKGYLKKKDSRVTEFEGKVYYAIEKGVFTIQDTFGNKRWVWGAGKSKGRVIVDVNVAETDVTNALMTHVKENISQFAPDLDDVQKMLNADTNAEAYLNAVKQEQQGDRPRNVSTSDIMPSSFEETKDLFFKHTGSKYPAHVSKLWLAIQNGTVDHTNVKPFIEELVAGGK